MVNLKITNIYVWTDSTFSLLADVLHFKLDASGFLAAFPYLLMAGIVQSAGILADYARTKGRLSTTFVSYKDQMHNFWQFLSFSFILNCFLFILSSVRFFYFSILIVFISICPTSLFVLIVIKCVIHLTFIFYQINLQLKLSNTCIVLLFLSILSFYCSFYSLSCLRPKELLEFLFQFGPFPAYFSLFSSYSRW